MALTNHDSANRLGETHVWGWLLRLGCCGVLAVRRRYPVISFVAAWTPGLALLVSTSGQVTLPASVRHRWHLDNGGPVDVIDLGFGVLTVPKGKGKRLLNDLLPREAHAEFVASLSDDPTSPQREEGRGVPVRGKYPLRSTRRRLTKHLQHPKR